MPAPSKSHTTAAATGSVLTLLAERTQLDYELDFFGPILDRMPDNVDVLRVHAANLALKGQPKDSLPLEQRLAELLPDDAEVHYQLAGRYAALKQPELALATLRRAIDLGFQDFRGMLQDRNLESLRKDPRFKALLREYSER